MKIVHVCLCGPVTDGWNYQENKLTKYHKVMGLDVTMIASEWIWNSEGKIQKIDKTQYVNEDGVTVIRLPMYFGNVSNRFKKYKGLLKVLKQEQPDILFVHGCQFLDILTIVRYLRKYKTEVYVDNHVDYSNGASNWISKNILHKIVWRYVANKIEPYTTKFYGVLPSRVTFLEELYKLPASKCELLVMGADDQLVNDAKAESVRRDIRSQYHIGENDFLVMTGGKIDAFKTQTILLMEAVKNIKNNNLRLIVFGSVSEEMKEKVHELADGEKIQYIGWIDASESYKYFASSDLVVFPGRHSVFWEQVAAQGIPMLCKKWNGTTHVDLGGNVHFLTEDSVEEIQTEIETLLNLPEKYDYMKKIAVEEGMKAFSYSDIARRSIRSVENEENKI